MNKSFWLLSIAWLCCFSISDAAGTQSVMKDSIKSGSFENFKKRNKRVSYRTKIKKNDIFKKTDLNKNVIIKGLERINRDVVAEYVVLGKNSRLSEMDQIDLSIKKLRRSGLFSDVKISIDSARQYIITVRENPLIEQVVFEGNDSVNDSMLRKIVSNNLVSGKTFNKSFVQESVSNLQMAYKSSGFPSATIVPKIISLPGHRVNVVFEIKEGNKTVVERIIFCGNRHFSKDVLKSKMNMQENIRWKFWDGVSGVMSDDKIYGDIEALKDFYKNNGFPNIKIERISSEMDYKKEKSYVTVVLKEGKRYRVSTPKIESAIFGIKGREYKKFVKLANGDWYSVAACEQDRQRILQELARTGKTFVDVAIDTKFDEKRRLANITYKIVETKRLFVERIDITGNNVTADYVIRDRFRFHEGDPINPWLIETAKMELENTGYFENVDITSIAGSLPDKLRIIVKVREKESTSSINLAASVNDVDGLGGMIGYNNTNFRGHGQLLASDIMVSQKSLNGSVALTEPNFIWKDVDGSIEIGGDCRNRKSEEHARYRSYYFSPSLSYKINDNLSHTLSVTALFGEKLYIDKKGDKIKNITGNEKDVYTILIDEFGHYKCVDISSSLAYAKNDGKFNSRRGFSITFMNTYAGFLANTKFFKSSLSGEYYMPIDLLDSKTIFSIKGQVGHIHEIKNVRSSFRFQFGGDGRNFRGFDTCGVSPREWTDDSIGGTNFWSMNFAIRHPLSGSDVGLFGSAFIDIGSVWGVPWKYNKNNSKRIQNNIVGYNNRYKLKPELLDIADSKKIRISAGVSIEWKQCPIAPLTFTFAVPLKKAKFDRRKVFTLSGLGM